MQQIVEKYTRQFSKLKRAYQHGGAPHKPALLLAILSLVDSGQIQSNRIFITPELIMSFRELWSKLVNTPHQMNFALPFFHMRSEPFWKLVTKPGTFLSLTSSHSVKSLGSLNESIQYAELDADLFILMKDSEMNAVLTKQILQQYFAVNTLVPLDYTELHTIEKQILNDDQYTYKARIESIENNQDREQGEEELFIRSGVFKREIPKIYNYTCAISRMHVATSSNAQLVDACHIVPFSVSKNDTITNGISLCPNMHRAFDRGLIAIDENYKVKVSPSIVETDSPFSLKQFDGVEILLPNKSAYFPLSENFQWHLNEKYFT
jgi:putative restriction endonuclease